MNPNLVDWQQIETVLLDMDGTLLDLGFDNYFWREHVPAAYAALNNIDFDSACALLFARMAELRGTLDWYCVEFWSTELGLDIVAMKTELKSRIRVRPGARAFLEAVRISGRRQVLVTNAHRSTLEIKLTTTAIGHFFDRTISSHDLGAPKEDAIFWKHLQTELDLDPVRCLFIDDSPAVLEAAHRFGISQVVSVERPDSSLPASPHGFFPNIDNLEDIAPQPMVTR